MEFLKTLGSCWSLTHDLLIFVLILMDFSLPGLHSPLSLNSGISQGFLFNPLLLCNVHPITSALIQFGTVFSVLFPNKTQTRFGKGLQSQVPWAEWAPAGQPAQLPVSDPLVSSWASSAGSAPERKCIPHWGNPLCFWVIPKTKKFCELPHCFYFGILGLPEQI